MKPSGVIDSFTYVDFQFNRDSEGFSDASGLVDWALSVPNVVNVAAFTVDTAQNPMRLEFRGSRLFDIRGDTLTIAAHRDSTVRPAFIPPDNGDKSVTVARYVRQRTGPPPANAIPNPVPFIGRWNPVSGDRGVNRNQVFEFASGGADGGTLRILDLRANEERELRFQIVRGGSPLWVDVVEFGKGWASNISFSQRDVMEVLGDTLYWAGHSPTAESLTESRRPARMPRPDEKGQVKLRVLVRAAP